MHGRSSATGSKPGLASRRSSTCADGGACTVSQPDASPSPDSCRACRTSSRMRPSAGTEAIEYRRDANGTSASASACASGARDSSSSGAGIALRVSASCRATARPWNRTTASPSSDAERSKAPTASGAWRGSSSTSAPGRHEGMPPCPAGISSISQSGCPRLPGLSRRRPDNVHATKGSSSGTTVIASGTESPRAPGMAPRCRRQTASAPASPLSTSTIGNSDCAPAATSAWSSACPKPQKRA